MTDELRTTLHRIADDVRPEPVAADLWQRGRAARRRGQDLALAAVLLLVVSVAGAGAWVLSDDREAQVADTVVAGGAIPSRIGTTGMPFETELPTGRASVAFFASGGITLIGAEDGSYHQFAPDDPSVSLSPDPVLALSPDGLRLAWTTTDRIAIADLESGDVTSFPHNGGRGADVTALTWWSDSTRLLWNGRGEEDAASGIVGGLIDVTGPSEGPVYNDRYGSRGFLSPSRDVAALPSRGEVTAAPFLQMPSRDGGSRGTRLDRPLPTDLHPDGAVVRPVGWAEENLVVAVIDPPPSDVVERPRLAIFTSPDRPESEWTYREFLPDLPPVESLSVAVDLIPDLDGTSSQQLTRDFPVPEERDISWMIGLGVAAAIALLLALQYLWRRLRP